MIDGLRMPMADFGGSFQGVEMGAPGLEVYLPATAAGVLIAWLVAITAGWSTDVTVASVALSTGVALAVGLVSGLYPARRAAALDPIDALRYE